MNFTRPSRIISKNNRFSLYEPKNWIDEFLKYLNHFFFQKPRKSTNAPYYQKNLRFLYEINQKVLILVEKLKKNATSKNDL